METLYPIKFSRGKLVKYPSPIRYSIGTHNRYSMDVFNYNTTTLSDILEWVNDHNGKPEDTVLYLVEDYGDPKCEIILEVPRTQKELDAFEKDYQKRLKQYNEWLELSKKAKEDGIIMEKLKRSKSLKTQENNLLRKLENIRKQRDNL